MELGRVLIDVGIVVALGVGLVEELRSIFLVLFVALIGAMGDVIIAVGSVSIDLVDSSIKHGSSGG
jgi:hypothetical protein